MRLFTIALLIALPSIIFAQSNYQPGYVLKNNGDTLKGFVNYPESGYFPVSVDFKVSKTDKAVQQYTPNDIKAFQITGFESYVSYVGVISTNKNIVPNLPYGLDTSVTAGAVFLKPLITGKHLTLFYNNEPSKNRFFIAETNGQPVELKYYTYYDGASNGIVEHNTYRGQLQLYNAKLNNGNSKLLDKINDVMFNEADLARIVNLINNNGGYEQDRSSNTNKKPSGIRLFASLGANSTNTKYTYAAFNPAIPANTVRNSSSTAPKIALGADFFINPNVQRIIFRLELSYSYSNDRFDHSVTGPNTTINMYSLAFTERTFSVTPQILVNVYNKEKLKIYIDGGVSDNNSSTPDNNPIVSNGFSSDYLYKFKSFWVNYSLQAGAVFNKRIELFVTYYTAGSSVTTFPDNIDIANKSICVGVKYLLGGK